MVTVYISAIVGKGHAPTRHSVERSELFCIGLNEFNMPDLAMGGKVQMTYFHGADLKTPIVYPDQYANFRARVVRDVLTYTKSKKYSDRILQATLSPIQRWRYARELDSYIAEQPEMYNTYDHGLEEAGNIDGARFLYVVASSDLRGISRPQRGFLDRRRLIV